MTELDRPLLLLKWERRSFGMKLTGPAYLWLFWWVFVILMGLGGINDTISVSRAASVSPGLEPLSWAALSVYGGVQLARDLIRLMRLRADRKRGHA